jgi:hypothetical protein
MDVQPQADGSLWISRPDADARFDVGNARCFAAFDGRGATRRVLFPEGLWGGSWSLRIELTGQAVEFQNASGAGRLWRLQAEDERYTLALDSFLDSASPAVYQRLSLRNRTAEGLGVRLTLRLDWSMPLPATDRRWNALAGSVPHLPGLGSWWGKGLGKVAQAQTAKRMAPGLDERTISATGAGLVWASDAPFEFSAEAPLAGQARFDLSVGAGEEFAVNWVLAMGAPEDTLAALARSAAALQDAQDYATWLAGQHHEADPLLQSLYVSGLNAAMAMYKEFPGGFAGLLAGTDYAYPPRLYFRDSYWTAQALLPARPDRVRTHLLSLARGVHRDGTCPSGVFAPHIIAEQGIRAKNPLDWLPDHYDSPSYFILLVSDYLRATGDHELLRALVPLPGGKGPERSIWQIAQDCLRALIARDRDGDGLLEKPYAPNDWADNVYRSRWVTYDQALFCAALQNGAEIAAMLGEETLASFYRRAEERALAGMVRELWDENLGAFINYRRDGFREEHFSIDTLVALFYDLPLDERKRRRMLAAARELQTRINPAQPYGDWGVMSCFPLYHQERDRFGKSAQPYGYHNGADWPYWDGVYGWLLRREENEDWTYVLSRWWRYGLERGWLTPIEYYSPPFPPGGRLQGWSSTPAAAFTWDWRLRKL